MSRTGHLPALVMALAALSAGACEEPFSPLASSEGRLSIFGYLDAAADTQWIRVMPIRPLSLTEPSSSDIRVTLENLGTGRVIEMRDSLFSFYDHLNPELESPGTFVHNYWTTEAIEPGGTYRFSASRPGGEPAEAVLAIPPDYDLEVWIGQPYYNDDQLRLGALEHVPFVLGRALFFDACGAAADSVRFGRRSHDGTDLVVSIEKSEVVPRDGCGRPRIEKRELRVVASGAEWPSGWDSAPENLGVPEQATNITNAVGFLGGLHTKVVPYESCSYQGRAGSTPSHCRLQYNPRSATLRGIVTETRCGDGPVDTVTVELRELDGEPADARKVRTTFTDRAGSFLIGALEPGMRYGLRARAKPEWDPFWGEVDIYTIHTDTVQLSPGEVSLYPIQLRRLTECGGGS